MSGQPNIENGKSPDENHVSSTSGSKSTTTTLVLTTVHVEILVAYSRVVYVVFILHIDII